MSGNYVIFVKNRIEDNLKLTTINELKSTTPYLFLLLSYALEPKANVGHFTKLHRLENLKSLSLVCQIRSIYQYR